MARAAGSVPPRLRARWSAPAGIAPASPPRRWVLEDTRLCRQLPARTPGLWPVRSGLAGPRLRWARTLRRLTRTPAGQSAPWDGPPPCPRAGRRVLACARSRPGGCAGPGLWGRAGCRMPLPSRRPLRAARALAAGSGPRAGLGRAGEGGSGGRRAGGREAGPGRSAAAAAGGRWRGGPLHRRGAPHRDPPRRPAASGPRNRRPGGAQPAPSGLFLRTLGSAAGALVFTGAGD